ncbi:MAG: hypothetical protein HC886_09415 [Leptolyngbyaceae cyanobacterium SM1_1_3]|nr:hypothetical protein [Leptolyngbyaceae cyanobacterium SM1_1_3]NJN01624.1 hypothetical protein [Leptolyngbyaceae cyanobacterium RM1_1_2]
MVKAIALLSLLFWLTAMPIGAFSGALPYCQTVAEQEICLLSLRRSAKYYWQYRAAVSIAGIRRPVEVYDCQRQQRVSSKGREIPFQSDGPGLMICSFFKK